MEARTGPVGGSEAGSHLSYLPALDGIRALSVLGVMAYHSGIPFLPAGFLGVDAFFVLSGFLITSILLDEWARNWAIRLAAFWARRARRLLPALVLVIIFVACYATFVVPTGTYPTLRSDGIATLFYVANWHFIIEGANYFNQTALPSPLTHAWSLGIEEQFYLLWPLLVVAVLKWWRSVRVLLAVAVVGTLGSATEMALLYRHGENLTRLYYGTDTHGQSLLVGVTLAIALSIWASRRAGEAVGGSGLAVGTSAWVVTSDRARLALGLLGAAGFLGAGVLWWRVEFNQSFLWEGGFLVVDLAVAAVILCVVCVPSAAVGRLLSLSPLRSLGRISYGVYLWHYPLFVWIDGARTGLDGYPLFVVRVAATLAVAVVSYVAVEQPFRRGLLIRGQSAWVVGPTALAITVGLLVGVTLPPGVAAVASGPLVHRLPPASPVAPRNQGAAIKVVVEGDSTALTLGLGLAVSAPSYDVEEFDTAVAGCGVTEGAEVEVSGVVSQSDEFCNGERGTEQWPAFWAGWIEGIRPNVVVVLAGRWEVANRTYEGRWTDILHPSFAAYVKKELNRAVTVASSTGARVVLMTAPCYDSGEQPDGDPWPEDSPARLAVYNRLVHEVAVAHRGVVTLFDLHALVCPDGRYEADTSTGLSLRAADGVHFTLAGGEYLATKVWPVVVKLGREQMQYSAAHR